MGHLRRRTYKKDTQPEVGDLVGSWTGGELVEVWWVREVLFHETTLKVEPLVLSSERGVSTGSGNTGFVSKDQVSLISRDWKPQEEE